MHVGIRKNRGMTTAELLKKFSICVLTGLALIIASLVFYENIILSKETIRADFIVNSIELAQDAKSWEVIHYNKYSNFFTTRTTKIPEYFRIKATSTEPKLGTFEVYTARHFEKGQTYKADILLVKPPFGKAKVREIVQLL